MSDLPRVALFAQLPPEVLTSQIEGIEVSTPTLAGSPTAAAEGAVAAVADWTGQVRIEGGLVDALAPTCRLVQVPAAGTDSVDVDACHAAGIPVASCAGANQDAVADWCVWGLIDAMRGLSASVAAVQRGEWPQLGQVRYELAGTTVGIVGLGTIGTAVARRLVPFGCDLAYWSRTRRDPEVESELGVAWRELDDLVAHTDALVLACALTPQTRGLLSAERIASMQPRAVVVNAARGEVTDETALAHALAEGRLHGAAIDAFAVEPLPADHPLRDAATASLTPHVAGTSAEAVVRILQQSVSNVTAAVHGGEIVGLLDPAVR